MSSTTALPAPTEYQQVVIIGSGFGGLITALRLSEAGIPNVVLERGQQWNVDTSKRRGTFPSFNSPDKRTSWMTTAPNFTGTARIFTPFKKFAGVIERVKGDNMDVLCASCVGGGSVVYGAMCLKPEPEVFQKVMPAGFDWEAFNDPTSGYYEKVKNEIGFEKIDPNGDFTNDGYKSSREFKRGCEAFFQKKIKDPKLGKVEFLYSATDYSKVSQEFQKKLPGAYTIGDYIYGCNSGAKKSVDTNYLVKAQATGHTTLRPLHQVKEIFAGQVSAFPEARYLVQVNEINADGKILKTHVIACKFLFMCAGSINTSKILVKAKATGTLPALNSHVGLHWGNNGDLLMETKIVNAANKNGKRQAGPPCVYMNDLRNPDFPVTIMHGPGPMGKALDILHMLPILGMSIPTSEGAVTFKDGHATLKWQDKYTKGCDAAIRKTLSDFDKVNGSKSGKVGLGNVDLLNLQDSTYHPLGGCVHNRAVDLFGRFIDDSSDHKVVYPGFYVVDSSLLPGTAGAVNPSWTVAANCERIIETLISTDLRTGTTPVNGVIGAEKTAASALKSSSSGISSAAATTTTAATAATTMKTGRGKKRTGEDAGL